MARGACPTTQWACLRRQAELVLVAPVRRSPGQATSAQGKTKRERDSEAAWQRAEQYWQLLEPSLQRALFLALAVKAHVQA